MIASQNDRSRRVVFVPVKWSRVKWSVAHWEKSPQKWSTPKPFPVKWSWRQLKPVSLNTTTSRPTSCCLQNVTAEGRRYSLIKKRRGNSLIQGCRWESFQKHVWVFETGPIISKRIRPLVGLNRYFTHQYTPRFTLGVSWYFPTQICYNKRPCK